MVQNKVKFCFGEHLDMLLHMHSKSIHLDAGYGLRVRPLTLSEFEYICKEHHAVHRTSSTAARLMEIIRQAFRGGHSMVVGCALARCVCRAHEPSA
eukprot:4737487-Pleurochrysis_carterae.AAC.2